MDLRPPSSPGKEKCEMDKKMSGFFRVEKRSAQQGPCVSLGGPNAENGLSNPLILGFKVLHIPMGRLVRASQQLSDLGRRVVVKGHYGRNIGSPVSSKYVSTFDKWIELDNVFKRNHLFI